MAKLNAATRKKIPTKDFALPGRRYPIEDRAHGVAALRLAHYASPAQQAVIKSKVKSKFGIGKTPNHRSQFI